MVRQYTKYIKKRLTFSRFNGFLASAAAIVLVVLYFLEKVNPWLAVIDITYFVGMTFNCNVTCQDIKKGSPWQKINAAFAVISYLLAIGLMVYALVTGELRF